MNIQQAVFEVVAEVSRKDISEVAADSSLVADLGIDSQSALHLLIVLEERLGLEIADEEAATMDTVGDILGFYTDRVEGG